MNNKEPQELTVVFRVVPGEAVEKIHASADWSISSWGNAVHDCDRLLDALHRLVNTCEASPDSQPAAAAYKNAKKVLGELR